VGDLRRAYAVDLPVLEAPDQQRRDDSTVLALREDLGGGGAGQDYVLVLADDLLR